MPKDGDARINAIEEQIAFEQRKKEVKEHLYKIAQEYFSLKKAQSFPDQQLFKSIQGREAFLLPAIAYDDRPLSVGAFPSDLYAKEREPIDEFVKMRSMTAKEIKPSNPGTIKRAPTEYEKWMQDRKQLDPFAYQMGSRPEIQIVAVTLLTGGTLSYMSASGVFSLETSMTAAAIKGTASATRQYATGNGVNVIGVASDAFLPPGLSSLTGNFAEWKPFNDKERFRMAGYNKTFNEFGIQAVTYYGIGKIGGYGFKYFSPYLETPGQQIFYELNYDAWKQVISIKASEALTENEGENNPVR
jgi:hypothetical protein